MEGTAQAHGATLLHLLLLHLMQPGAGAAGPGVGQDEAGQVAEAFLSPWGCLLVPKSSAVPFLTSVRACSVTRLCLTLTLHGVELTRLLCPWDFPGKDPGVGCHFLLQGIFLT